jgi:hypothetical protein
VHDAVLVQIWRQGSESSPPLILAQPGRVCQIKHQLHSCLCSVGVLTTRPTAT